MATKYKHVTEFNEWIRILESNESGEVEAKIAELNDSLNAAAHNRLSTRELMQWFHGMLNLYDTTALSTLIFKEMKKIFQKHYKKIYPILSINNSELTSHDIKEIKRYKQIASDEAKYEKESEDRLRELGLI